ncbi:MAG: class I SAM-dependent methyltransferase [Gracilibacteraceae bacterium]|jgi:O-methyltransferase involved in polyketide biosynthesis|nr:class I SAM-dependent methyltransferase [Gracilibacteraceae bacterium]
MENKTGLQGQTVQSTMLLAIYGRAKASRMFPDILRDGEAIRIVGGMDHDFTQIDKHYGTEYGCFCCLVRAKRLDERCLAYIQEHPNGTVVNLGSGLDTTFERVDNGSIRWYNVDLPDAMAFRHRFIPTPERCGDIARSMFDYTWLGEVETADGSVFILAGGLFYYFEEKQVRELICHVAEHFPTGEIFFDAQSKTAVKISNRMVRKAGNKGSEMKFWVKDAQKLKAWSPRVTAAQSVPFFGEARKQRRVKLSTKVNMWAFGALKMGQLISIQWGAEE